MGLTNAGFGMYGGINAITVPQVLSARHVPEATIAALTAVTTSPSFWAFLLCPILDVRFSRRWYSAVTAVTSTALLTLALLNLDHLILAEALLLAGYLFANLWFGALGGWLSSITALERQGTLSVWVNVANIGGGGIMAVAAGELMRRLPPAGAALAIGATVLLPIAVFPWMEAPGADRRLAKESFWLFFGELVNLVKRREVSTRRRYASNWGINSQLYPQLKPRRNPDNR
jgi:MFS transporter, PAT family, beta-lactamase induction signal transducer AmpG